MASSDNSDTTSQPTDSSRSTASNNSQPLSLNANMDNISLSPIPNTQKRKRKRLIDCENDNEPATKRQKTNTNTNSSQSSMKQDAEVLDLTNDHHTHATHYPSHIDTHWTQKVLGTLKLDYILNRRCSIVSIWHITQCRRRNDLSFLSVYKRNNYFKNTNKLVKYYVEALNEYKNPKQCNAMSIKVAVKEKRLIGGKSEQQINAEYAQIRQEERQYKREREQEREAVIRETSIRLHTKHRLHAMDDTDRISDDTLQCLITNETLRILAEKQRKRKPYKHKSVHIDSQYSMELEISLIRSANSTQTSFNKLNIPYTLGILTHTNHLSTQINRVLCVRNQYKKKHLAYTLCDLLEFACRYSYNIPTQDRKHQLNITLHEYQVQSLDWMFAEERDAIGFHRHLYARGAFGDDTPFYYSTVFEHMMIGNEDVLPVAHGGFLCEEMGLGKTIISLALINCNKALQKDHGSVVQRNGNTYYKSRATLIIAPVSLVGQWETECDDKSGRKLKYKRYYSDRSRDVGDYLNVDIVFSTYGIMQWEDGTDRNKHCLHRIEWHRIILDESHSIKSGSCVRSKSINRLKGRNKWCLSGTPFGNQVTDIANQLLFIGMSQNHVNRLQLSKISNGVDKFRSSPQSSGLMYVIQKLVMRHRKNQRFNRKPIVHMVGKHEEVIFVEFTDIQRKYYDILYETAKQKYDRYAATGNVGRGYIDILSSLHGARQACSGYIYSKEEMERKLTMAQKQTFRIQCMVQKNANKNSKELYEIAKHEAFNVKQDGECPICYECPLDTPLQTPCRHLFCAECIQGVLMEKPECPLCRKHVQRKDLKTPPKANAAGEDEDVKEKEEKEEQDDDLGQNEHSDLIRFDSKMKVLMNELKKIKKKKPKEKSLIFTSFSKSLEWICSELRRHGLQYRTLCGSMTLDKRKKQLAQFADNPEVKVFVLTVRTGAVGITLTSANHVFMLEPTFNAALHRQAINRVYRLGQKKKVFIHTMIMKDSIEERIWNINKHKKEDETDVAGSINADTKAKLQKHEISKLFQ